MRTVSPPMRIVSPPMPSLTVYNSPRCTVCLKTSKCNPISFTSTIYLYKIPSATERQQDPKLQDALHIYYKSKLLVDKLPRLRCDSHFMISRAILDQAVITCSKVKLIVAPGWTSPSITGHHRVM